MRITKIRKADRIALLTVLLAILVAICVNFGRQSKGGLAVIRVDRDIFDTAPLALDKTIVTDKDGHNVIKIENGEARMAEADCPDGLCLRQNPISRAGEAIICLPNKVMISIEGQDYDAISR